MSKPKYDEIKVGRLINRFSTILEIEDPTAGECSIVILHFMKKILMSAPDQQFRDQLRAAFIEDMRNLEDAPDPKVLSELR